MGFRTIAYLQSANPTSYTAINVVPDASMTQIDATHFKVPSQYKLVGAYGYGTILTRYKIITPSLKANRVPPSFADVDQTANNPITTNPPFMDLSATPVPLVPGEGLEVDIITTGGAAAVNAVILWLADDQVKPVTGIFMPKVRATSSQTLTQNQWTNCVLSFEDPLPAGTYAVVGMRAGSAGALAARLVFPDLGPRPGVLAGKFPSTRTAVPFSYTGAVDSLLGKTPGVYYAWGTFVNDAPPSVEFLSISADNSEVVELDLVKVA